MAKAKDLTGLKFGRLTAIEPAGRSKNKCIMWRCVCDCGNEVVVKSNSLNSGNTKSCGCLHKEGLKKSRTTHGMTHTRQYKIWCAMKARCYDKNNISFKYYGGVGIKVCNEWRNDFLAFYEWAMKNGYADDLTIDRINTSGDYSPDNCRWITISEQQSNRRNNNPITYNGKTQILSDWAKELGISRKVLSHRISSYHWDIERAFTQKVRKSPSRTKKGGETA